MPFQLTVVWEGAVPRSEAVERVALPDDLMKIVLFWASTSAIVAERLSLKTLSFIMLFCTPMSRSERAALTTISSTSTVRKESVFWALKNPKHQQRHNVKIINLFIAKNVP